MTFLDGHDAVGKEFEAETQDLEGIEEVGALKILKRGLNASPELKAGVSLTALMALAVAGGKLLVPLTIKEVLDRGITTSGVNVSSVLFFSLIAMFLSIASMALGRATYYRLAKTAENVLMGLRVRTFEHLHKLSIADHVEARKGAYTARVTSDVETLTQFAQWGAIAWIINSIQILAVLVIMVVYSWHLSIVTLLVHAPLFPVLRWMQRRQLRAHDRVRSRVSDTLSVVSESIQGVDVVRSYGYRKKTRSKLHHAIGDQYKEQMVAQKYFSFVLPITDIIGVAAIASVVGAGVYWGPDWGVTSGELIAFVFLSNLLVMPISELGEVLTQTQTALAGWWKVLEVLDKEVEVKEPDQGMTLPDSPLDIKVEGVDFSYRTGGVVLDNVDIYIPAGISVAVVGETGSGKTTFAKLLTRLADRAALQYAIDRGRNRVHWVHKGNIMKFTEGAFQKWGYELVKEEFSDQAVAWEDCGGDSGDKILVQDAIADIALQQVLTRPEEFDVIATMNLNGDYLSDALAAQVGGIGIAPGANANYMTGGKY